MAVTCRGRKVAGRSHVTGGATGGSCGGGGHAGRRGRPSADRFAALIRGGRRCGRLRRSRPVQRGSQRCRGPAPPRTRSPARCFQPRAACSVPRHSQDRATSGRPSRLVPIRPPDRATPIQRRTPMVRGGGATRRKPPRRAIPVHSQRSSPKQAGEVIETAKTVEGLAATRRAFAAGRISEARAAHPTRPPSRVAPRARAALEMRIPPLPGVEVAPPGMDRATLPSSGRSKSRTGRAPPLGNRPCPS